MKKLFVVAVAVCGLVSGAQLLSAQSLGDVARREAARRKAVTSTGKVYTNDSLRPEPPPVRGATAPPPAVPSVAAPAAPQGHTAAQAETAASPAADARHDESHWTKRLAAERDGLARAQTYVEALQSRINALSNDFAARDDPAQRSVIAADRQRSLAELDRLKFDIQQHATAIAAIQEEARRAGVPAGWVR
jgi:hypothetical protein